MYDKVAVEFADPGMVDIKLHHDGNTNKVYWSDQGNSFVMVKAKSPSRHTFVTPDGQAVRLLSINGAGEIRWACTPGYVSKEEYAAAQYFELQAGE